MRSGQAQVSLIYTQLNQYYVVMEVDPQYLQTPAGLNAIYFHTTNSGVVPLKTFTTAKTGTTPISINHTGLFPSVTVSFNLAPGLSLSDATREIDQLKERLGTPQTIRGFFAGTLQAYQDSLSTEPYLILTALLAVYIVLGILYESLVHPLTIISDAAFRKRRGHAGADDLPYRFECDLDHRHHSADRHREEECDHDDRLCAGS